MIRYLLILCTFASAVVRSPQDLINLVGRKGEITHLYDLYTRGYTVSVTEDKYGAKTDGTDAGPAIKAAIDTVYNRGGGTVFIPAGSYAVSSIARNWSNLRTVNVIGAGTFATKLYKYDTLNTPIFDFSADCNILETYSSISDMNLDGRGNYGDGIRLTRIADAQIARVHVSSCRRGLDCVGCLINTVSDCRFRANHFGAFFRKSTGGGCSIYANSNTLIDGSLSNNDSLGLDFGEGQDLNIFATTIETNGSSGVLTSGGAAIRNTVTQETGYGALSFYGTHFEGNSGRALQVDSGCSATISLHNFPFYSSESGRAIYARGGRFVLENIVAGGVGDSVIFTSSVGSVILQGGTIYGLGDTASYRRETFLTYSGGTIMDRINGILRYTGSGTPEGSITGPVGSIYQRTNGGAGTSFYVKESGTGNTGWVGK